MEEKTKGTYGRNAYPIRFLALLLAVMILVNTGCSGTANNSDIRIVTPLSDSELFKIGDEICTVPQAMILISAQKKVVEDVYGKEIWSVKLEDLSFEDNVKELLKDFLARMACMKLMADANQITLSNEEKKQVQNCTETYLSQLTKEEVDALGITEEDVQTVFTSYYYYNKLMESLTSDMETEISDNDARIVQTECIYVKKTEDDQTKRLKSILKKAKKAGEFAAVAEKYDEGGQISRSIFRGQLPSEIEEAVFSMTDDQISDVLEAENGYYIFHCVEDYDRDATAEHKAELVKELKEEHFTREYDDFVKDLTAQLNEKAWKKISLSDMVLLSEANFFEIYNENVDS